MEGLFALRHAAIPLQMHNSGHSVHEIALRWVERERESVCVCVCGLKVHDPRQDTSEVLLRTAAVIAAVATIVESPPLLAKPHKP